MSTPLRTGTGIFRKRRLCQPMLGIVIAQLGIQPVSATPPGRDAAMGGAGVRTADPTRQPRELGRIAWLRGFDGAAKRGRSQNRPLLVLFQEVPGCGTCVNYGDKVLSHPLIVDAAETLFVPVAVYNNIKGEDLKTLTSFKEPAWNNPVVRIVTPDRSPLASRVAEDYTVGGMASAMVTALQRSRRNVPNYLQLLAEECAARKHGLQMATFAMHCFWEGESALGGVRGVIATQPGFLRNEEVVEVQFDPRTIEFTALLKDARAMKCASRVYARDDTQLAQVAKQVGVEALRTDEMIRPDQEPKYYLSKTPYQHVPMTQLQAARVNAAIYKKQDPLGFLSPGQIKLFHMIKKSPATNWPNAIGADDLPRAWSAAAKVARTLREGTLEARRGG